MPIELLDCPREMNPREQPKRKTLTHLPLGNKFKWIVILAVLFTDCAYACTDFRLTGKDGTQIITRSMEFALPLHSNLRTSNRNRVFHTVSPLNRKGLSWTAQYGYVYLDGLDMDAVIDGMNEKGLSFEALYLPDNTEYQRVPANHGKVSLPYFYLGDWILSNFANVDEVKAHLPTIYVFAQTLPHFGQMIFPLHFSVFDTTGKGIVIEYVKGKLIIHDNKIGVLTNSPTYDWHLTNLNNYIYLAPYNPQPVVEEGIKFGATGQGYGMIGMPGDISPSSRFVKVATMLRVILIPNTTAELLNLAEHIINNVDIPLGLVREPQKNTYINENTQWVVFKDLTHKVFYYRTYDDLTLRSVDITKINFDENAPRLKMPIANKPTILDKTNEFIKFSK